jgi:hypothetical protein
VTEPAQAPALDLAAVAAAHPVRHVMLDLERIEVSSLLSVGDIVDMAEALETKPEQLLKVLDRTGGKPLDVLVVLAWIIGRKGEPDLELETVRRTWRVEVPGIGTADPTPAAAGKPRQRRRSSGPRTSSGSRG